MIFFADDFVGIVRINCASASLNSDLPSRVRVDWLLLLLLLSIDPLSYIYLCLYCVCIIHFPTRKAAATPEALLLIFNICW